MPVNTPVRTVIEVPRHDARSKALVSIKGSLGGYDPAQGTPDIGNLVFIGDVTKIEVPIARGSAERRELRWETFGQILEQVPGLVDFEGFTLNKIVTYKETFLEACGFRGHNLMFQSYPMYLLFDLPSPNPGNPDTPNRLFVMEKVWIKTNPMEFSVEEKDDLRITQKVDLAVGNISEVRV